MKRGPLLVNVLLACFSVSCVFVLMNSAIPHTSILGGISLSEFIIDEARILFFPSPPEHSSQCINVGKHRTLIPLCESDFYGNHIRLPKTQVIINSLGIRDKEYSQEKPDGTYRVFILGDSITFGEGVNIQETFSERLEKKLNSLESGMNFEVFNLGVPGTGTDNQDYRLLKYLNYSPDLVILQTSVNDIFECESLREKIRGIFPHENLSDDEIYRIGEQFVRTLGMEERCSCVRQHFWRIVNRTVGAGIPLIIYDLESDENGTSCFKEGGVGEIRFIKPQGLGRKYRLSRGDSHFNPGGHEVVAEHLYQAILLLVANRNDSSVP